VGNISGKYSLLNVFVYEIANILKAKYPETHDIDKKPDQVNVYANRPRSKGTAAPHIPEQAPPPSAPNGYPYGYYAPAPTFTMQPVWYSQAPNPMAPAPNPATPLAPNKPIKFSDYPQIIPWLKYCDGHPDRCGEDLSSHAQKFEQEGYRRIHQLGSNRVSVEKLSEWLGIGKGTADLLIQYAEEDIELVKSGTFTMAIVNDWDNSESMEVF
jgi:hypothetical protein